MEKIKIDAVMDSKEGFNQGDCDQGALPGLQEWEVGCCVELGGKGVGLRGRGNQLIWGGVGQSTVWIRQNFRNYTEEF